MLDEMLSAIGQTKQTFYETYTKTALRLRRIPFIIAAPQNGKVISKTVNGPEEMGRMSDFQFTVKINIAADSGIKE